MSDKKLQETKELNAKARENSTADGASKVSITRGDSTDEITKITNKYSTQEAKDLNINQTQV
jgi:hypothetical protein